MSKVVKISRRNVLQAGATVACCMLVPGLAEAHKKGTEPQGQSGEIMELQADASYDLSAVGSGEMVVFKNDKNFIGIIHRNAAQIEAAQTANVSQDLTPDSERVFDDKFLVVNLRCEHRGCQVAYTGEAEAMFRCPCHKTSFDSSGRVLPYKPKTDQNLAPVSHMINGDILTFVL